MDPAPLLILMYHHAGAPPAGARKKRLYVDADRLAAQVRLLQHRGYRFTTVSDAQVSRTGPTACVTFDDGYRDALEVALPVLRPLGAPATLYVVTEDIGRRGIMWPEEQPGVVPADLADWDELRTLAAAGWEIGSHAHRHLRLARRSKDEQRALIDDSFRTLAAQLGDAPRSFAYPYGSYGAETAQLVRAAGFTSAVTTRRGRVQPGDDPFQLRRVNMFGHRGVDRWQSIKLLLAARGLYPLRKQALLSP